MRLLSPRRATAGVVALAVSAGALMLASAPSTSPTDATSLRAVGAATDFLATYVELDGRVARLDQGGDTVSEGQAYAMLLAVSIADEDRFRAVWEWTASHLQRDDGLLAWRWRDGDVVDGGAASDGDLLTAWALGLAGIRFGDDALTREAKRVAGSVVELETVPLERGAGRMLVAGPWATTEAVANPSYLVLRAMSQLWWITGDSTWAGIAAAARTAIGVNMAAPPHLPSDWATLDGAPAAAPDATGPRFGYDAARVLVQLATDCDPAGRAAAAEAWPFFERADAGDTDDTGDTDGIGGTGDTDGIGAVYSLQGDRLEPARHPVVLVAAAAAADAAGDEEAASRLLDDADDLDDEFPTYYGSAWIALTRIWLDTEALGRCSGPGSTEGPASAAATRKARRSGGGR